MTNLSGNIVRRFATDLAVDGRWYRSSSDDHRTALLTMTGGR